MKIKILLVTPAMATTWLAKNKVNRPLSDWMVEKYRRDMVAGAWLLTGETIIISAAGWLLNGQHRLTAIVRANVAIELVVVFDAADDSMHAIDTGKSRTTAQVLAMLGHKHTTRLASVVRYVAQSFSGARTLSVAETEAAIKKYPGISWIMGQPEAIENKPTSIAPVLAGFAIAYGKHPEVAADAWASFCTGAGLHNGNPILALRNYLTNTAQAQNATRTTQGRTAIVRRVLTALYYKATNQQLHKSMDGTDGLKYFVGERAVGAVLRKAHRTARAA